MDRELQKYFETYFELFATPGWTQFVDDMASTLDGDTLTAAVSEARTERDLGILQGEIIKAKAITILEAQLRAAYDQHQEDADDE